MSIEPAAWWPPKVGDRLRKFTLHGSGGNTVRQVHALCHVLAVFDHDGETRATIAEWLPTRRRWNYETIGVIEALPRFSKYWPDGQYPPTRHPCVCCEDHLPKADLEQ
jgi:hypothetical protein